jgi:hypothetical protein
LETAALLAMPLPAAAQDMCAALNRIAAAAREPVPFSSLRDGRGLVPGYGWCRVHSGTGEQAVEVYCNTSLAPRSLIAATVGAQIRDCLGAVRVPGRPFSISEEYRTDTLSISVSSHCDERCHVGRLASILITRRREDPPAPAR